MPQTAMEVLVCNYSEVVHQRDNLLQQVEALRGELTNYSEKLKLSQDQFVETCKDLNLLKEENTKLVEQITQSNTAMREMTPEELEAEGAVYGTPKDGS